MDVFRVFPWRRKARAGEPGHPLYVPPLQGRGRIDNPGEYAVLYVSDSAAGSVAERLGGFATWNEDVINAVGPPGTMLAIARIEVDIATVLDLDDARALLERDLRPSDIATGDRSDTQTWGLRMFQEARWAGVRWWSRFEARWGAMGIWDPSRLRSAEVEPLHISHPAFVEAGTTLRRL